MIAALSLFAAHLVPLALDGESVTEGGNGATAVAVISAISLVGGYLVLFALWRYVFSAKAKAKRGEPPEH